MQQTDHCLLSGVPNRRPTSFEYTTPFTKLRCGLRERDRTFVAVHCSGELLAFANALHLVRYALKWAWYSNSANNHGWELISSLEGTAQSVKAFYSKEFTSDPTRWPKLTVTYVPEPTAGMLALYITGLLIK